MATNGYGQTQVELNTLEQMTPDEKTALIRGEYLPERLVEFGRSRDGRDEMLRRQLDQAYQFANAQSPVHPSANVGTQVAGLIANALRTFGGAYMANEARDGLKKSQDESDAKFEALMNMGEGATGAGLSTKQRGLSGALRGYGGGQ